MDYDLLFNPKEHENPPTTIEELRNFVYNQQVVHPDWAKRGGPYYLFVDNTFIYSSVNGKIDWILPHLFKDEMFEVFGDLVYIHKDRIEPGVVGSGDPNFVNYTRNHK